MSGSIKKRRREAESSCRRFLGAIYGFDALMSGLFHYYLAGSVVYGHHVDTGGEMQA